MVGRRCHMRQGAGMRRSVKLLVDRGRRRSGLEGYWWSDAAVVCGREWGTRRCVKLLVDQDDVEADSKG